MKKTFFPFVIILFITGNIFTGCQSSADKVEKAREDLKDAQINLEQAKQDSVNYENSKVAWDRKLESLGQDIASYKATIAQEKEEERLRDEKVAIALDKRRMEMKAQIAENQKQENETWENFKKRIDSGMDELSHDMNELGKALKDFAVNNK